MCVCMYVSVSVSCDDERWIELAENRVHFREIGCEDGSWVELGQDRVQWRC